MPVTPVVPHAHHLIAPPRRHAVSGTGITRLARRIARHPATHGCVDAIRVPREQPRGVQRIELVEKRRVHLAEGSCDRTYLRSRRGSRGCSRSSQRFIRTSRGEQGTVAQW